MNTRLSFDPAHSEAIRRVLIETVADVGVDEPLRRRKRFVAVAIASSAAVVLTAGSAVWALDAAGIIFTPASTPGAVATAVPAPSWPVNASGQTYGAQGDSSVAPDLVRVQATNGAIGYVFSKQLSALDGPPPTSPKQALDWQAAHAGESVSIPVYQSDGKTVVGEFEMIFSSNSDASPAP